MFVFFFFKQKTAYEMRISDWSSDVCSSDLIERLDSDRLGRRHELERLLDDVRARKVDVLVGTQILAKGHDFPNLSLVGIVSADQALYGADFRAIERMGQLVTQVAGRAGRAGQQGTVLLQTPEPEPIGRPSGRDEGGQSVSLPGG